MKGFIATAVAALMIAGGAEAAGTRVEAYKGRGIEVTTDGSGDACLAMVKKAIDMTSELKPRQRTYAAEIKDLKCSPMPEAARSNAVEHNTIGIYTFDGPDGKLGYIRFPLQPNNLSAADIVRSLVGNGGYARWHRAYQEARRRGADDPEARRYRMLLTRANPDAKAKAECEMLDNDHEAVLALDLGERKAAAIQRQMRLRGCP